MTNGVSRNKPMTAGPLALLISQYDFQRRASTPGRCWSVLLAEHVEKQPSVALVDRFLADMRAGRPLDSHLSPMKVQRAAFKRAHKKQDWAIYRKFMDHLLNKWGFRHFHCDGGAMLVFVHFCERTGIARVIDLVPHDGNWRIEKRLVEIVVRNWPNAGIAAEFGRGGSRLTEEDLLLARKQGLNMTVNVDGAYYLPAQRALMSDGTSYELGLLAPIMIFGRRFDPMQPTNTWIQSPTSLVLGVDPDDPRSPTLIAAGQAGLLAASGRRPSF